MTTTPQNYIILIRKLKRENELLKAENEQLRTTNRRNFNQVRRLKKIIATADRTTTDLQKSK